MLPSQPTDCAVLVLSCDPYADLWTPFFSLFHKHWPDCPFQVLLGAGETGVAPSGIRMLRSAGGRDWSKCAADYLAEIEHPYVLIMLDDFFLRRRVPTMDVLHCLEFARAHAVTQLRLIPRPGPTEQILDECNIGSCSLGSPYRLSTQAAIWDRSKLASLLRPGESIWEFEHNGNLRASAYPSGFYSVWRSVLPYQGLLAHHVVEKGRWLPHETWIFGRQEIGCDFSRRETMSWPHTLFYHAVGMVDRILKVLPWRRSQRIKCHLKSLFAPLLRRQLSRLSGVVPTANKDSRPSRPLKNP